MGFIEEQREEFPFSPASQPASPSDRESVSQDITKLRGLPKEKEMSAARPLIRMDGQFIQTFEIGHRSDARWTSSVRRDFQ